MEELIFTVLCFVSLVSAGVISRNDTDGYNEQSTSYSVDYFNDKVSTELTLVKFDNRSRMSHGMGWVNCPTCGVGQRNRIVGGRKAAITENPWMVSIHKSGVQHCGASVIDNRHILTAAHCVLGVNVAELTAIASVTNVYEPNAFRAQIKSFINHPQFEPQTYDYDIAILTLDRRIPLSDGTVRPVCIPDPDDDPTGGTGIVLGWGALTETAEVAPEDLRKVELPIISNEKCHKAAGLRDQQLTNRMMCAGYIGGSRDACSGDSGGPLVWENKGRWKQVGIVSWGIGCARPDYYGVFTRVTAMFDWISRNVQNLGCD